MSIRVMSIRNESLPAGSRQPDRAPGFPGLRVESQAAFGGGLASQACHIIAHLHACCTAGRRVCTVLRPADGRRAHARGL